MFIFKFLYHRMSRSALRQIIQGRMRVREKPEAGRFLQTDVRKIYDDGWSNIEKILQNSDLSEIPTLGNRHNVFLAIITVGMYHALLDAGIERSYAIELLADVGWKIYGKFIPIPKRIARLATSNPQHQINLILRMFMRFPFNAPGRPGYEVRAWAEEDRFLTYWTFCPPFHFVKQYTEMNGDRGELEVFDRTWCSFDWALTYAMTEGSGKSGYYARPHTLSRGDDVCDMCWSAEQTDESIRVAFPAV
ncbi:MAG: hypothetical protein GTO14_03770 [Anaerolineales bacterium]|nr:hypothetical protein [Anaerolineales bacterium]